jgi:large repetitive protein
MGSHRFDDIARLIARLGESSQSRRNLFRVAVAGGAASLAQTRAASSAPDRVRLIRARNQETAVDPFIDDMAFRLTYDPERIFAFVRDEVGYDPYPGVLRGARGTLWGLAGNSADQAILLAALLEASMVKTRFVLGELANDYGSQLLASLRLDEAAVRARVERVFVPAVPEDGAESAELTAEEKDLLVLLSKAEERFRDLVDRQFGGGMETVLGALSEAGIILPEPEVALPDLERTQHVWLQYAAGPDWVDLDPSIPNAEPGATYAAAADTLDQLPDELFHRVSMRLVAEKVLGGVPALEELLAFEAASAELVGVPITLMHPNADSLKAAGVAIQEVIGGYRNFIPALIVGSESRAGRPVTFVTGGGVLEVFDQASIEGDTLGEWLEIAIRTPSGNRKISRELFDRVGITRRSTASIDLEAIPAVELVDTGGDAPGYPPLDSTWSIGVVSGAVPWDYFETEEAQDPLASLSRAVHAYHFIRDVLTVENAQLSGQRFFIDEPNVAAVMQTESASTAGEKTSALLMDLLHRHLVAVPIDRLTEHTHPYVAAGVFGHAVERAMIETAGVELLGLPGEDFISVGRVFDEAKRQGIPTVVLRSGAADLSRIAVDEAARARIEAAVTEGYVVIVPERPVALGGTERSGWWLVNPATGDTQDQLDDGRGATLIDYAFTLARILICAAAAFHALGLVSLIRTYGAGSQLQQQWIQNRVVKLSIAGGLCVGSFAV